MFVLYSLFSHLLWIFISLSELCLRARDVIQLVKWLHNMHEAMDYFHGTTEASCGGIYLVVEAEGSEYLKSAYSI